MEKKTTMELKYRCNISLMVKSQVVSCKTEWIFEGKNHLKKKIHLKDSKQDSTFTELPDKTPPLII